MPALNYDDSASQFVGITLLAMYSIPAVIHIVRTILTWKAEEVDQTEGRTADEKKKYAKLRAERGVQVLWTPGFKLFVGLTALTTLALIVICVIAANGGSDLAGYDPYSILGIDSGATEREIKSAYRQLSRVHHPDRGGDAARFTKIAKAYGALMDPEARANWEKYGNPDGKQSLEVAIGIPSILVHETGKYFFMLSYFIVLVGGIPFGLHYFWRKNQAAKHLGDFDLYEATNKWLGEHVRNKPEMSVKQIPELLAGMAEFLTIPGGAQYGPFEAGEVAAIHAEFDNKRDPSKARMAEPSLWNTRDFPETGVIPRNNAVLHAHMNRRELQSPVLRVLQESIVKRAQRGCEFMFAVAFALTDQGQQMRDQALRAGDRKALEQIKTHLEPMAAIPQACALITQAMYLRDNSLLQLFPRALVAPAVELIGARAKNARLVGLRDLLEVPRSERLSLLAKIPSITEAAAAQYAAALDEFPLLDVSAEYAVQGEDFIAEGDIVTLTVKLSHRNLLDKPGCGPDSPVPPVLAPFLPASRPEQWVLYVLDRSANDRMITGVQLPFEPKKAVDKIEIPFRIMKQGKLRLSLQVQSMSYVGLDVTVDTTLEVAPRPVPAVEDKDKDGEREDLADKTMEAMLGGTADDESDVSDAGSEAGDDSDGEEEGSRSAIVAAKRSDAKDPETARGKKGPIAELKNAPVVTTAVGAGAGAGAGAEGVAEVKVKPVKRPDADDEIPSIVMSKRPVVVKGSSQGGGGQPAGRKAGNLLAGKAEASLAEDMD